MTYGTSRPEGPGTGRDRAGWWSTGFVGVGWGWWAALAILVVAVVLAVLLFVGAMDDDPDALVTRSVADIVDQPSEDVGDRVAVSGRIDALLTDRAVVVGSDLAQAELLVLIDADATIRGYGAAATAIAPVPAGEFYEVGDVAQFAGELREFEREAMADELGLVLNEELFGAWDGRPVLVMDRLDVTTLRVLDPDAPQPTVPG